MDFLNQIWNSFSKPKVSEELLSNQLIPIIKKHDILINKSAQICTTGFGNYYQGKYMNQNVSIKVVNITQDETIINEFLLWQFYQKKTNHVLHMIGVCLIGGEALIVFKPFAFTLEQALTQGLLSEENKLKITLQCLEVLKLFNKDQKSLMDIRPGTFGLTENLRVKLLDFGLLVNMETMHKITTIEPMRIRYTPPEYVNNKIMSNSYDIWSFGCLLIDIFSPNSKVMSSNLLESEIKEGIATGYFPKIPKDINSVLKCIIKKCLNRNHLERISIDELDINLKIIVDNFSLNSTIGKDEESPLPLSAHIDNTSNNSNSNSNNTNIEQRLSDNDEINERYQLLCKIDEQISNVNDLINGELQEGATTMKNNIVKIQEKGIRSIIDNHSALKQILNRLGETQTRQIIYLKDKILEKILHMQDYFSDTLLDLIDIHNQTNELKLNLKTLNQMKNRDQYDDILKDYEAMKKSIKNTFEKYTDNGDFDKVYSIYEQNKSIVNLYQEFAYKCNQMVEEFIHSLSKYEMTFTKDPQKIQIAEYLGIKSEFSQHEFHPSDSIENLPISNNSNDSTNNHTIIQVKPDLVFPKVQDNSSIVIIYNTFNKKLHHCLLNQSLIISQFNSKSYSYYDHKNKAVFISGGLQNPKDKYSYSTDLFKLKYYFDEEKYAFDIEALASMKNCRCSHSMLMAFGNYLFAIGGINTKTCECYSIKDNKWEQLPIIPSTALNPCLYQYHDYLFVFTGGSGVDAIYTIDISHIGSLFIDSDHWSYEWQTVIFAIPEGRLRRGMGAFANGESIYLLGGFDNDNKYDDIYEMNMNLNSTITTESNEGSQRMFIVKKMEKGLPLKTYFTTNIIMEGNYFIMVDGLNNGLEYNIQDNEFYYYS